MLTYEQAITICQSRIGDSSDETAVKQALDIAQVIVCRSRRWPELIVRDFFNTVAAYDTGTVAITTETTTVTLTDGTWPTALATGDKYRFALSASDPWYVCQTRTSGSVMVLLDAYVDATVTASSYIVYKSHYALPAAVDRVEEIWLHRNGATKLTFAPTDNLVTNFMHYPSGTGVPTHWMPMERSSTGTRMILLGPETPDDVYRVEYVYRKKPTAGTFEGNLDDSRWPLIVSRALMILYEDVYPERAMIEARRYERMLRNEWANESEAEVQTFEVGGARIDYPQKNYYDTLLGRGKVADPS